MSFGAEIPTTSMHWKREGHDLEWIVRQMSWTPPWTPCDSRGFLDEHPAILKSRDRSKETETMPTDEDTAQVHAKKVDENDSGMSDADPDDIPPHDTFASAARAPDMPRDASAPTDGEAFDSCALAPDAAKPLQPRDLWQKQPAHIIDDCYGYNRIPAFWFTLNLPFNYLFEIHRFQRAVEELTATAKDVGDELLVEAAIPEQREMPVIDCLDSVSKDAMSKRCNWVLNNPDIVVMLHAIPVSYTHLTLPTKRIV